jgi:hypothetical protein
MPGIGLGALHVGAALGDAGVLLDQIGLGFGDIGLTRGNGGLGFVAARYLRSSSRASGWPAVTVWLSPTST